jgi:MFS family permease
MTAMVGGPDIAATTLLARPHRALTIGSVALISLIAYVYLAVATSMPTVARELHGLALYPLAFGGALAASVVGIVVAGGWSDTAGPRTALYTGVAGFVTGLTMAALAQDMVLMVLGRIVQGLGGGMISVALYVVVGRYTRHSCGRGYSRRSPPPGSYPPLWVRRSPASWWCTSAGAGCLFLTGYSGAR